MFEGTVTLWRRLTGTGDAAGGRDVVPENRRIWVRHPCNLPTQGEAPGAADPPLPAQILDISVGGAKVAVNRAHEAGSLISLELPGPDGKTSWAALACVVHDKRTGPEEWVLGCNFSRDLDDEQLRAFGVPGAGGEDKRTWRRFEADV